MLNDVLRFLVMYVIFLFAFSILMVGAGDPRGAIDKCNTMGLVFDDERRKASASSGFGGFNASEDAGGGAASSKQVPADQEDFEYMHCWQSWWFFRTLFQAFGEFYLDEMTNDLSIVIVIALFILMNIVLMNLLIAMMAGTFEEVHSKVGLARMLELYRSTLASFFAFSSPCQTFLDVWHQLPSSKYALLRVGDDVLFSERSRA